MYTLVVPDSFSDLKNYPKLILNRMRKEFAVNGIYLEGNPMISLFVYDNDTFVVYPYVDNNTYDSDLYVHVKGGKSLLHPDSGRTIDPLYIRNDEAVFCLRASVGKIGCYKIVR